MGVIGIMPAKQTFLVFIASPNDLAAERRAFKEVIDGLNDGFAAGADVKFDPLGWEDTLSEVGRRPQDEINKDVDRCDVFILAMYRRWGDKDPDIPPPATSRTQEEFLRAFDRRKKTKSPRIFVFFKKVDPESERDPGLQLKKVLRFRKELEKSRLVLYRSFDDEKTFRSEIERHLKNVAKPGEPPAVLDPLTPVNLAPEYTAELEKARADAERQRQRAETAIKRLNAQRRASKTRRPVPRKPVEKLALARADELALTIAEQASKAALNGRVEEARQLFAKAQDGTTNFRVLSLAYDFYDRIGESATAERILERWLAISGPDAETFETATALGNKGVSCRLRGDLDQAERLHRKAMAINRKLGRDVGVANAYVNLGLVFQKRGDVAKARQSWKKARDLYAKGGVEFMVEQIENWIVGLPDQKAN